MDEDKIEKSVKQLIRAIQPVSDRFSREQLEQMVRDKVREKGL